MGFSARSYKQINQMNDFSLRINADYFACTLTMFYIFTIIFSIQQWDTPPKKTAKIKPNFSKMKFLRLLDKAALMK